MIIFINEKTPVLVQGITGRMGSFHAPFAGIHGWFWENRSLNTIVVEVYSSGYYQTSTVFRDGGDYERVIEPVAE